MFIGRTSELEKLEREYQRDSSFVVIYGRRRVGKTTLIKKFISEKKALYFLATQELEQGNMRQFARVLSRFMDKPWLEDTTFPDWDSLFEAFANFQPTEKKILVIDEFQYLAATNPAFTSIFQRIWDQVLQNKNIMVILCGSLISMMRSQVLTYSSPLYGRRTAQIRLAPLKFTEIALAFPEKSFDSLVELYAVTGGVPKYLEFFLGQEIRETIKREILSPHGFLYEEPIFLLDKEVKEPLTYFSIIAAVAAGNRRLSQIASKLELSANHLSPYIKTLIDLNLLERRVPVTEKNPHKSRRGLYYISDSFLVFWFRFVAPYKSELELGNVDYVYDKLESHFLDNHVSFVFEDICRDIFLNLAKGNQRIHISKIGSWWNNHHEIDIVAFDEEAKIAYLGECKYWTKPVGLNVLSALMDKAEEIKELQPYEKRFVLFSHSGFSNRLVELAQNKTDVLLINKQEFVDVN
jgi:AAA+ ATPase superfamily predicted ATPase